MEEKLWLIWKEPQSRRRYIIGGLVYLNNKYTFKYVNPELDDAKKVGFSYFPGFSDINSEYTSENELFPNIDSRLPNSGRPEYLEILNLYDLDIDSDKMEILKKTKGRLLTDNFEFVPVFDKSKIEFEIAGTSHSVDLKKNNNFEVNDNLYLEKEDNNKYDENAIKIICKKNNTEYHLGYVPRYYSKELSEILKQDIKYSAKIKYFKPKSKLNDENVTLTVKLIFEA